MSRIVIGVPGLWEGRRELLEAVVRAHVGRYLFAGFVLMDRETGQSCGLEVHPPDERMAEAFEIAGQGRVPPATLQAVAAHRSTAYLLFDDPGYETARTAARFAGAILGAGGIAVKVESAGVAHGKEVWLARCGSEDPLDVYALFVTLVGGGDTYYSCGMHNFGLPDASVGAALAPGEAARLLNVFNLFQLTESPALADGHTFGTEPGAPYYRLRLGPYEGYDPDEPLYNPHGLWHLERI